MFADPPDVQLPQPTPSPPPSSPSISGRSSRGSQRATPPRERRRRGLACAECRRSKLKCDRNVPCQTCVKRDCSHICPNGTMKATKGTKALKEHVARLGGEVEQLCRKNGLLEDANALLVGEAAQRQEDNTRLREQVSTQTARIRDLEAALTQRQPRDRSAQAVDKPESSADARRRMYSVGSGSLAIDKDGLSRYYGDTTLSEFFTQLIPDGGVNNVCHLPDFQALNLPDEIVTLFNAFPLGLRNRRLSITVFGSFLPPRNKAMEIAEIFYDRYGCIYGPVPREDFTELINKIYGTSGEPNAGGVHAHRLALFFAILAIGHQRSVDFATSAGGGLNRSAERYYVLACAALSLAPLIAEAMAASVQALFLVLCYLGCGTRRGCEESWLLIGVMARVGFRIGLHRDGEQFGLGPAEVKRRRHIFWELYRLDAWISFANGRAPAINLADTDTKFPEFEGEASLMPYPYWKYRYAAACLWPTTRLAASVEAASYEEAMALDRRIRTFPVPAHLHASLQGTEVWSWSKNPAVAVQQYCIVSDKELSLVFLHRNYLAVALHAEDPLAHRYGDSVLAAYRCATRMCFALRDLYKLHPRIVSSVWYFWSGIFSSCIVLAAIPIMAPGCRTPTCNLAQCALENLKQACLLYQEGAVVSPQINGADILRNLERHAETTFRLYWSNPAKFTRMPPPAGETDEMGGQEMAVTHAVASRSHSNSPNPVASQVSHMRTQPPHSDPLHGAMQDFLSGAYGDLPAGAQAMGAYQQLLPPQQPFAVTDDVFMFSDVDHAFLTSSVPTYEEIMQAYVPQPPHAAPMFLPPTLGFHPSTSSAFSAPAQQQQFAQSAFYAGAPPSMDGGMQAAPSAFAASTFWESLQWASGV